MKKKNLNHQGLKLRKSVISNFASESVKGGTRLSCFADLNTNCPKPGTLACPSDGCPTQTDTCPTNTCPQSISCQPNGIC